MKTMNKNQWTELFVAVGLDEKAQKKWHALFESKYPDAHQSFLEWLGLSPSEINAIRTKTP